MGLFYFMKYTTKTKVVKGVCLIGVYRNREFWHLYEFSLERYKLNNDATFLDHIKEKSWGTDENVKEICIAILPHLLS